MTPKTASVQNGTVSVTGMVTVQGAIGEVPFEQQRYVYVAPKAEGISIDGNLNEWSDTEPILINTQEMTSGFGDGGDATKAWSLENCSGSAKVKWDAKNIYLAVEVKDNVHYQEFSDSSLWNADSLQIAFDTRCDGTGSYGNGIYELLIGKPDGQNAQLYKGNGFSEKGLSKGAKVVFVRDETDKSSIYEISIPIAELDGMTAKTDGSELGFSMLINDNDGQGRVGYMQWSSGIGGTKDARLFGSLWLKD